MTPYTNFSNALRAFEHDCYKGLPSYLIFCLENGNERTWQLYYWTETPYNDNQKIFSWKDRCLYTIRALRYGGMSLSDIKSTIMKAFHVRPRFLDGRQEEQYIDEVLDKMGKTQEGDNKTTQGKTRIREIVKELFNEDRITFAEAMTIIGCVESAKEDYSVLLHTFGSIIKTGRATLMNEVE